MTTSATGIVIPEDVTSTPTFEKEQELWRIAAIVQCAITIIYLLIITFFWRKINIAAAIISEASKAVKAMPSILIFPVAPILLTSVVAAWWLYVAGGLYTAGTITTGDIASTSSNITGLETGNFSSSLSVQEDMNVKDYLMAYHIFSWLWLNNFVHGIAMTTICGAFAGWYWTVIEDGKKTQKDRIPVIAALWRVVRYHLGSIAYGSGIIAVIQFIRVVLAYIDKRTKNAQKSNVVLKVAIKVIQCCMYCFEKFIKFVSRNAYIIIAIKGSSFCSSTMTVFGLLLRHGAQINLTSLISSLILMLGKLILVAGAGAAGFVVLEYTTMVEDVSSKILPIAFIIFISFLVATAFLDVYDLGIASILICFCIDLEENQAGSYMFSESLARAAGKKGQTRASSSGGQSTENMSLMMMPRRVAPSRGMETAMPMTLFKMIFTITMFNIYVPGVGYFFTRQR